MISLIYTKHTGVKGLLECSHHSPEYQYFSFHSLGQYFPLEISTVVLNAVMGFEFNVNQMVVPLCEINGGKYQAACNSLYLFINLVNLVGGIEMSRFTIQKSKHTLRLPLICGHISLERSMGCCFLYEVRLFHL